MKRYPIFQSISEKKQKEKRWIPVVFTYFLITVMQVNVVKGLKLYEDVFTDSELAKLSDFVSELRSAGQTGELSGAIPL